VAATPYADPATTPHTSSAANAAQADRTASDLRLRAPIVASTGDHIPQDGRLRIDVRKPSK
jgi:hypothetical protein